MISNILLLVETTLLLSVAALYIMHCPFNKVEESFNTQAVHDIINLFPDKLPQEQNDYTNLDTLPIDAEVAIRSHLPWDHMLFPGVVPRTFIGALLVGFPMKLARYFMVKGLSSEGEEEVKDESEPDLTGQFVLQIGSRFALASFVILSLSSVTRAIHKRYGLPFRLCFLLCTVSQFHYMFYAGRFIPNTFAAILANLVFASWINRQYSKSVIYIAFCVIIFRFDTALFFGWLLIDAVFVRKYLTIGRLLRIGIPAGLMALFLTFSVDSLFWARPVWPEFESIYFNVWLNKSNEWGTASYYWYIYSCLPRIMLASTPFILLADHKITRDYFIPTLAFIFTYSMLPHKELRFILFINPFLNISAASGLLNVHFYLNKSLLYLNSKIFRNKNQQNNAKTENQKSYIARVIFILVLGVMFVGNIFASFILSSISSHNYPGGQAALSLGMTKELLDNAQKSVDRLDGLHDPRSDVGVYVDNLAAQTGVSRFVQVNGAYYAKTAILDKYTFRKRYKLIYLIYEPKAVPTLLRSYCPPDKNLEHILEKGTDSWKQSNTEVKCVLPNQAQMYCSIIDSTNIFKTVNIGGLLRIISQIASFQSTTNSLDDTTFIKTRVALHMIRCSTRSRFNPFAD